MLKKSNSKKKKAIKWIVIIVLLIVTAALILKFALPSQSKSQSESQSEEIELIYSDAIAMIKNKEVSEIQFTNNAAMFTAKDGKRYEVEVPNQGVFMEFIQNEIENGQEIQITTKQTISFLNLLVIVLPLLFLAVYITMIIVGRKRMIQKIEDDVDIEDIFKDDSIENDADRCRQKKINKENVMNSTVKFSDVAGLEEEKFELMEIVDFLKNPEKYQEIGAKIPRGILLAGAPGTGKTLLAKALAGEADVPFLYASGSEFVEMFVGVGAGRIRSMFKQARMVAPCIIFIDEIDAIGAERINSANTMENNQTLEQLLTEMDGFASSKTDNIIVIAATNRLQSLDKALLRPGRFDRQIIVNLPDIKEREEILKIHAKNKKIESNVDLKKIANNTSGFSGAELENLLNEASIMAVRNEHKKISNSDIDSALKKIVVGLSKNGRILSEKERSLIAYHECGHAVVSMCLKNHDRVKELSIVGAGDAGGYTWYEADDDSNFISKSILKETVISLLGGRAAEEVFMGDVSTGATRDLMEATDIITKMIVIYGMDELVGPISMEGEYSEYIVSDGFALTCMNRVKEVLCEAKKEANRILKEHSSFVEQLVKLLLEKETISGEELEKMFSAYKAYMENENL